MKRTLFNIGEDYAALGELLDEIGGEITSEQAEEAIDEFFAELGDELNIKLDGYAALIREREARAKARDEEAKRIAALAQTDKNTASRLKGRLKSFLEMQGKQKIETARAVIAIQNNGGKAPVILDEYFQAHPEELPEGLRKVVFTPDLDAIRAQLESGEDLGFAEIGERGTHLRIR